MPLDKDQRIFAKDVAALVHKHQLRRAAQLVADSCGMKRFVNSDRPKDYLPVLQVYLNHLLNNDGMVEAAQLLWTPNQFTPEPQSTKDTWDLFEKSNTGLIMGAASMSKSFGMGVRLFLEWVRDPMWTTVRVIGPSEDHLQTNLFSHLVGLKESASLPIPGQVGSLFLGLNRRNLVSSIKGLVIPIGKVKKAGRLQGTKRKPRPEPHPEFGNLTRLFIFLDEAENIPGGVWSDIDNVLSNLDEAGTKGLKIFMAYNPTNQFDEVGVRAEPPFGWAAFDVEKHFRWVSKRGWDVLRLDGEKSENVISGRTIFPGLQTAAGLAKIAQNAGGKQSPGYFSMGRGAYPPQGVEMTIIPSGMVPNARGTFIWYNQPQNVMAVDGALEGGATASVSLGKAGYATGIKWPASLQHPTGRTEMFKDDISGTITPRFGVQLDQQFPLPKGDTVQMKDAIIDVAKKAAVRPDLLCLDRTGNFAGAHDLIKHEWSSAVIGVNYSSSPTELKIMQEDEQKAEDAFDRIDSELWFALRAFMEFKVLLINPQIDMTKLSPQLTQRLFRTVGGRRKVESKKDYKSRGNDSPDEADSLTLFVHAVRKGMSITPSMRGALSGELTPDQEEWWEGHSQYAGGARIDPSNMVETLEGN